MNRLCWLIFGCIAVALMTFPVSAQTNTNSVSISHAAQGDLDGDGYGDVIIQHSDTRYVAALGLVENELVWSGYLGGSGFSIDPLVLVGTLDLDLDGIEDILWRNGDSDQYIWSTIEGTNVTATETLLSEEIFNGWDVVATADFDDDGYGDVLVRNKTWGLWAIGYLVDFELVRVAYIEGSLDYAGWTVVGAGDVDGDGFPDVIVERSATGEAGIVWMQDDLLLDFSPIHGEESESLWPWRVVGLTDIDGTDRVAFIMQLGRTGYHEVIRPELVDDVWVFDSEPLAGFSNGLGKWRVIGPR